MEKGGFAFKERKQRPVHECKHNYEHDANMCIFVEATFNQFFISTRFVRALRALALRSLRPYARSGYQGQDVSFYDKPMVMIWATINALTLL